MRDGNQKSGCMLLLLGICSRRTAQKKVSGNESTQGKPGLPCTFTLWCARNG